MNKILIIEDDIWISKSLKLYLENSSFEVFLHSQWSDAVEVFQNISPDLLILDINLPWKNGDMICKEIREFSHTPILVLTARSWEIDKLQLFEIWADDYIAKPFSPRELLARIQSILRRFSSSKTSENQGNIIKFKHVELNTEKITLKVHGKDVALTKNEYDILKKILEEDGKVVHRETLMKDIIWYSDYLFDRTIDTHIKNIRKKLEDKDMILTIRGEWYRLNK